MVLMIQSIPTHVHGRYMSFDPHTQYERLKRQIGGDTQKKRPQKGRYQGYRSFYMTSLLELLTLHSRPTPVHSRDICFDPHTQYERLKQRIGGDTQKKACISANLTL